jgi:uncharacterized MAPEG superfamily protein
MCSQRARTAAFALSIVLGLVHIVLAHAASLQRGYVWAASSRDEAVPALTGVAGRLARALQNFGETFHRARNAQKILLFLAPPPPERIRISG